MFIGVAIAAMVMLNLMSSRLAPKGDHDDEAAAADHHDDKADKPVQAPSSDAGNALVGLGPDATAPGSAPSGPFAGKQAIVRYEWTPQVAGDPKKVYDAVTTLQKSLPGITVKVENVDATGGDQPTGVFIGGKQVAAPAADGSISVPPDVAKSVPGGPVAPPIPAMEKPVPVPAPTK